MSVYRSRGWTTRFATVALALALLAPLTGLWIVAAQQTGDRLTRLQGSAYLGRRSGLVGAVVLVREESDPGTVFVTSTDEKGQFRVDGLHDGNYRVWLKRDGYRTVLKQQIEVRCLHLHSQPLSVLAVKT